MKKTMLIIISLILILSMGWVTPVIAEQDVLYSSDHKRSQETYVPPEQSRTGPTPPEEVIERDLIRSTLPPEQGGGQVLLDVPSYSWRHGCGPTALGMVVGFFDNNGFPDLIPGDASTQTEAVDQAVASGGEIGDPGPAGLEKHFENYASPIDDSGTGLLDDDYIISARTPHPDNSIADYMDTSKSTRNNFYGWSWSSDMGPAFVSYVRQMNESYYPSFTPYWIPNGSMTWSVLTNEIDAGRPMVFLVDSSGNGYTDHFVTVIGYRTSPTLQYASWDTWDTEEVRWENFAGIASGVPWGIYGGWTFNIKQPTFDCSLVMDVSEAECEALVALYYSTNGDEWINNTNWLETNTVGDWNGVNVLNEGVRWLYLRDNQLMGFLPSNIGNLTHLVGLEIDFNQLGGDIPPSIGDLDNLENLTLRGNNLSGSIPPELGSLSNLRALLLNNNQLTGSIPSELGDLSMLVSLILSQNALSGSIPAELANIPELDYLDLSGNRLSSEIPSALGGLDKLTYLSLADNLLSGSIPESIGDLTIVERVDLSCNNLTGYIPDSITNLENLKTTILGNWEYVIYGLNFDYNWLNTEPLSQDVEDFLAFWAPSWRNTQGKNETISPSGGIFVSNDGKTEISIPAGAVSDDTEFSFMPRPYPYSIPSDLAFAGMSFQLTASSSGEPIYEFAEPLTIKIYYDQDALGDIAEDSLALYYFDYGQWMDVVTICDSGEYTRNFEQNWFSVPICHLSEFAVLGEAVVLDNIQIYLPILLR